MNSITSSECVMALLLTLSARIFYSLEIASTITGQIENTSAWRQTL